MHQTEAISSYVEQVSEISEAEYNEILKSARKFNKGIMDRSDPFDLSKAEMKEYEQNLNISGNGNMGYVEIPDIDVTLPIFHGTSDIVLQSYVGHLEWSSLPVGGKSTHCVIMGHRGLPSAKLFTDLDKIDVGNVFRIRVLDEILSYEVDQIMIVDPHDLKDLVVVDGKDYCTLVTCTPYGVNTHRLLIRGHRISSEQDDVLTRMTSDAVLIEPLIIASILAMPMLLLLLLWVRLADRRKKINRTGM